MEKQRLQKILLFNKSHENVIRNERIAFYDRIERQDGTVISDIQTLAALELEKNGYKFLRIPMKSKEIGAFQLHLNDLCYVVLNTSKSLANNNFAVAHELYHVLVQDRTKCGNSVELYMNTYEDNEEEMVANAFAGTILMPTVDFKRTADLVKARWRGIERIKSEKYFVETYMVFSLMNYYQTTYMSVVIRCYELGIFDTQDAELMDFLIVNNSEEQQIDLFRNIARLRSVISIMEPTYVDNFEELYEEAKCLGEKNVQNGILSEGDFKYQLEGIKSAYLFVKEEAQCQ